MAKFADAHAGLEQQFYDGSQAGVGAGGVTKSPVFQWR